MCLISFAYRSHPVYKLIVAANRDEFYARPTRSAQPWTTENLPGIIAGKDLEAGGTWMGITDNGAWGALTNYRDPSKLKANAPSRGELVLDFLKGELAPEKYLSSISNESEKYNGFNLLLGDKSTLYHFSNHTQEITELEPGVHGLSNAVLNTPWPKLDQAKRDLAKVIEDKGFDIEHLFELLKNEHKPAENLLPDTGIPLEWEKAISSVFIKTDNYGTRCSTLLLIDYEDKATFIERKYHPESSALVEENTFHTGF